MANFFKSVASWLTTLGIISRLYLFVHSKHASPVFVTIRKPYIHIYDEPSTELPIIESIIYDQTNMKCPLPYMSSSSQTGCSCELSFKQIKCIYSDVLWKTPLFIEQEQDSYNQTEEGSPEWSIDLKCKNFTSISGLDSFLPLQNIKLLDMSYDPKNLKKICKFNSNNTSLVKLKEFGNNLSFEPYELLNNNRTLLVKYLNLSGNGLENFNLNPSLFNLQINELNLENNQLIFLENTGWLESIGVTHLYLKSNQLILIDVGFLVYLIHLDSSSNQLNQFSIEFYRKANTIINQTVVSNLVSLDFSNNHLTNLPFFHLTLIEFKKLINLNVSYNNLEQIMSDEFRTMYNLKELNLRENLIDTIESGGFRGLNSLVKLNLEGNRLKQINSDVFKEVETTLQKLVLDRNLFKRVPKAAFRHCNQLVKLWMRDNQVKSLEEYSFGFMGNLIELYLGGNLIEEISEKTFHIDPMSLRGPGLIEKIDLSSNRLTTLKSNIFAYLVNLRYLQLNNNNLKKIEPDIFFNVNTLITLDLSVNQLTDFDLLFISSSNLRKLRNLKLSHNKLKSIQPSQFICLASLTMLDLSFNQINHLSDCAFHGLQFSIRQLYLNYNKITQINSCAFSLEFKSLRFVQLAHNPLNCSNNCEFFYTVYRTPYSIDYKGIECLNNDFNLITTNSNRYCSFKDYENINKNCRRRLLSNDCLISIAKLDQVEKNQLGCEFQMKKQQQPGAGSNQNVNWTMSLGNTSYLQEKHKFLYEIVDRYQEIKIEKILVLNNACILVRKKIFTFLFLFDWLFYVVYIK